MIMLIILVIGTATVLVSSYNSSALQIERDKTTATALAQAKDALIGYAVKVQLSSSNLCGSNCKRPGDLPCPDNHPLGDVNEGSYSTPCDLQSQRLGRLPWKTLGLSDLRDGSGERLWYAVSTNFKNSTRIGTLNSDTNGTLTIHSPDGSILNDGSTMSGAIAVIIAPGNVLLRFDNLQQNRTTANYNNPQHYLDCVGNTTPPGSCNIEDNATFIDSSPTDGFIQGPIKVNDSSGNFVTVVNDQLLVVTQNNIMQGVQKRVAGEVMNCLQDYAANNNGRYPWAALITDLTSIYNDSSVTYFGRIPDDLSETQNDSWNGWSFQMSDKWGAACNTDTNNTPATWWVNWKEMVFYGVARSFRPRSTTAPSFPSTCSTSGNCLNVNTTSTPARFVVIVAGKMLNSPNQTQRYSNKTNAYYYLEGGNQNADQSGGYTFTQGAPSANFNDTLVFQ